MNQDEMAAALRGAAAKLRGVEPPERIEAKLLDAFCAHTGAPPVRRPHAWWQPVLAWTAAVAATVGLVFWLSPWRRPLVPAKPAGAPDERRSPTFQVLAASQWPADLDFDEAVEIAGDEFIALSNADQAAPDAAMDLVRVEVPRSAMSALGLKVEADRASESVVADVVLDADGVARAVRFVNRR